MPKVHILPPEIVSKIAAGEVIERPASVIKEVVENALDAGADTITVQIQGAGKTLIKVKDNGCGIAPDDLERIFARHATSKIQRMDDLTAIHSLGFRGEALYSIGAIADVTLRSRGRALGAPTDSLSDAAAETGWEIRLRGTERISLRPCRLPHPGTEIEIRELFYNTPARRKFLKNDTTEIRQIVSLFTPYTLLHNSLRFKLTHEERDLVDLAPAGDTVSRIAHALNLDEKHLLTVGTGLQPVPAPDMPLSIHLVMGDMNIQRARRDMQFIFVNNRPVQNNSISFHLNQIYRSLMPEGYHPFFAVFLKIPPGDLDVNVHPTKREVKIRNEQAVGAAVRRLCEETLRQSGRIKQIATRTEHAGLAGIYVPMNDTQAPRLAGVAEAPGRIPSTYVRQETRQNRSDGAPHESPPPEAGHDGSKDAYPPDSAPSEVQESFVLQAEAGYGLSLQERLRQARYVGSFADKYLLFQAGDSLLVMDQHAAAERIAYERLTAQIQKGNVEAQRLLSPVLIRCSPQEMLIWEEMQNRLSSLGLDTNAWDKETVAIHSHPLFLRDIERGLRYLLSNEEAVRGDSDALARRACRSSVMAGDILNGPQTEALRDQIIQCRDPLTCPHGRPTVIEVSKHFLDKQFLRT